MAGVRTPEQVGGGKPGPGRKKGVPNKMNGLIRDMILEALKRKGGAAYLAKQAEEQPVAFMGLLGKVLPMQVIGEGGGPMQIVVHTGVPRASDD